jgi:hypothetical protein
VVRPEVLAIGLTIDRDARGGVTARSVRRSFVRAERRLLAPRARDSLSA